MLRKWVKEIKGFEEYVGYSVTSDGKVWSHFKRRDKEWIILKEPVRELKQGKDKKGYCCVRLTSHNVKKSAKVHRLVALAFIDNPNNYPQIDHLDANKDNNDITNLEWVTGQENHRRKMAMGLNVAPKGERCWLYSKKNGDHPCSKKVVQLDANNNTIAEFDSFVEAAKSVGIDRSAISRVVHGAQKTAGGYKWEIK